MKVAAVIAEYNPFHNGHFYQLQSLRDKLHVDSIIIVMSGDFTQRGIPAIVDKYHRTRMALEHGADLVLELPAYFAIGSAAYFAQGAVSLLDKLGVVDILHFGSESGDIVQLIKCAQILADETPEYKRLLHQFLKQGLSYPAAKSKAFSHLFLTEQAPPAKTNAPLDAQLLSHPNNNLAIEYIKALIQRNSSITPATITRKGSRYDTTVLKSGTFASADALRHALFRLQNNTTNIDTLKEYLPETISDFFMTQLHFAAGSLLFTDDFSELLHYKMIHEQYQNIAQHKSCFSSFYDVSQPLSNTLYNHLADFSKFSDFALSCKSKNLTYTHIRRCLMHILLDMKQDTMDKLKAHDYSQYARLLGFCDTGKPILKAIKANASIPLITKPAKALKELNGIARESFCADIYASTIYQSVKLHKMTHMSSFKELKKNANELKRQIIILHMEPRQSLYD